MLKKFNKKILGQKRESVHSSAELWWWNKARELRWRKRGDFYWLGRDGPTQPSNKLLDNCDTQKREEEKEKKKEEIFFCLKRRHTLLFNTGVCLSTKIHGFARNFFESVCVGRGAAHSINFKDESSKVWVSHFFLRSSFIEKTRLNMTSSLDSCQKVIKGP